VVANEVDDREVRLVLSLAQTAADLLQEDDGRLVFRLKAGQQHDAQGKRGGK